MKGPLGFCQLMANKKNTNTQWNNFLRLQHIQRRLIRIPLPYPSPSFPFPLLHATLLGWQLHTHVRSSSFKVEFTFSASPMASAPSFPNPFHARFKDLMVIFSCRKQEQCITTQITTPLHIKIPSSFKLIMDY